MVDHPWAALVELPGRETAPLPLEKTIAEVFEESGRTLLILGGPGSGKTITLLELARDLLARAEADPAQAIPVVLNLSSWGERSPSFSDWVVSELSAKYQIPQKIGRDWLEHNEVLPLLDGLDELPRARQDDCVAAINRYAEDHGLSGIAVCSRIEDYEALEVRLKMSAAVYLQPLTPDQVRAYLDTAGEQLAGLKNALAHDPALLGLAQTPLMLNTMALAYRDADPETLGAAGSSPEVRRKQIFDSYIRRVLARRAEGRQFSAQKELGWLGWLAGQMESHNLSLFLIEALQPDWLDHRVLIRWYVVLSRVMGGLLLGLGIGALGYRDALRMVLAAILGVAGGLLVGIITARRFEVFENPAIQGENEKSWRQRLPVVGLGVGIPFALAGGLLGFAELFRSVFQDLAAEEFTFRILGAFTSGLFGGLIAALLAGFLAGMIFELIFGRRFHWQRPQEDIRTVDALKWSWPQAFRSAWRGAWIGALLGPVIGVPLGVSIAEEAMEIVVAIPLVCCLAAFLTGLMGALAGGVIGGMQGVDIPRKTVPNQGIWLSARNALIAGGLAALLVGLLVAVISQANSVSGWIVNLLNGLPIGFMVAVFFGLLDYIQHFTLRFFLWRGGHMPWRYARFLDQSADRILLRKVGGGYIFVHRLLQEHIARMDVEAFLREEG
jgi:DNA polymerase III delta prime subunit